MEVIMEVDVPKEHKKYVICKMLSGKLRYYSSYNNKSLAIRALDKYDNAILLKGSDFD